MTRRSDLRPPPPPRELAGFPGRTLRAGTRLHRIARSRREALWFGTGGQMRYDLPAGGADGTCYLAAHPLIALVETLGGLALVPDTLLGGRDLATVTLGQPRRLADLTSNRAAGHGVTAEIHTSLDTGLTQAWAAALHQAGFHGVRGWARHDLAHQHPTVTLFDTAGAHQAAADSPYRHLERAPLADQHDLLKQLQRSYTIRVVATP